VLTPERRELLKAYEQYSRNNGCLEKRLNEINAERKVLEELAQTNNSLSPA
jgi:hypothetical protein